VVADGNLSVVAVTLVGSHARRGEMKKRFSYRAYPDADQRAMLAKTFGCARVVYNDFVAYCRDSYEKRGVIPDLNEVKSIVTAQARNVPRNANGWPRSVRCRYRRLLEMHSRDIEPSSCRSRARGEGLESIRLG
jgi:transposase